MIREEEDEELKVHWGAFNDDLLEQWAGNSARIYKYEREVHEEVANVPTEYVDRPWLLPGADISDWFNFSKFYIDMNEDDWNNFLKQQLEKRKEAIEKYQDDSRSSSSSSDSRRRRRKRKRYR